MSISCWTSLWTSSSPFYSWHFSFSGTFFQGNNALLSCQHDHRAVLKVKREYAEERDTSAKKRICGAERGEADSPETVI